jgi:hypothetical protein
MARFVYKSSAFELFEGYSTNGLAYEKMWTDFRYSKQQHEQRLERNLKSCYKIESKKLFKGIVDVCVNLWSDKDRIK